MGGHAPFYLLVQVRRLFPMCVAGGVHTLQYQIPDPFVIITILINEFCGKDKEIIDMFQMFLQKTAFFVKYSFSNARGRLFCLMD